MTRIVTTHYRYKRPPRKRKAAPLEEPAIVTISGKTRVAKSEQAANVADGSGAAPSSIDTSRSQPAAVTPRSAIVTARRPGARSSVDVPDMTLEEHQRRGDAADTLFREIVRRATE